MAGDSKKVVIAAMTGNGLIAATKFVASAMTGSSAMFSEAIHSVADTGNQALLLYGMWAADRPPDRDHPFGYGKEIYFWSFVVAMVLFAIGAGVSLYEGTSHLLHAIEKGGHLEHETSFLVNYVVLGVSFLFELGAWIVAFREFNEARGDTPFFRAVRQGKDPSMFVVLFEDTGAGIGLVLAFAGVLATDLTGLAYFDGIASIMIGLLLAAASIWMAYETKGLLIGEAARNPVVEGIEGILGEYDELKSVNEIATLHMGPNTIIATISVDFIEDLTADEVEALVTEFDARIKDEYENVSRVFIEGQARRHHRAGLTDDDAEPAPST